VIANNLKAHAAVGYTNAYYPDASYSTVPPSGPPAILHAVGDKVPGIASWTAAANVEYSHDFGELWNDARGYIRADYRWTDKVTPLPSYNPNVANSDPDVSPYPNRAYGVLNIWLGIAHAGWDISAYATNVTNVDPTLGYTHDTPGSPLFYSAAVVPRTYGLRLWRRF